ncbi:UNVERIFIED_CONTAM: hypothetical protein GTU68_013238 [Idotea baltica]|nr:hypothetical protein [Idotea baltica]
MAIIVKLSEKLFDYSNKKMLNRKPF